MPNALKLELQTGWSGSNPVYGTTLYFDHNEVHSCQITNNSKCEILESLKHKPDVYDGTRYNAYSDPADGRIIKIDIFHAYSSTKTNLATLFQYKNLIKVYYKFIEDPSAFILCVLDPINKEYYFSGEQDAEVTTSLVFYETTNYGSSTPSLYTTGGISITPEVIIDPDDKNIKLDGTKDLISISNIIQKIDLEPGRSGIIENNDITITINNLNNYCALFNNNDTSTTWNPFRIIIGFLQGGGLAGSSTADIYLFRNVTGVIKFKIGDIVTLTNGINSETKLVTGIADLPILGTVPPKSKQRLTFDSALLYSYSAENPIQTWSFIGKVVKVNLRFENEYQYGSESISTITVYKGKIRETPRIDNNSASFTVEPFSNEVLSAPLLIKNSAVEVASIQRCSSTGTFASSIAWETKTGSGTLSDVTLYVNGIPGLWEVTFSNATDFTVTGPNCEAKAGTTASDFYDQTDASDSQIKIPSANWGGTPSAGDVLKFYASVSYNGKTMPAIVYDLLINQYGLTASDIDATTIGTGVSGGLARYISFSEAQTIGDALSTVLSGSQFYISQTYDGKFKLARFEQFDYDSIGSLFTLLDSTNILKSVILKNHNLNISDIYNEIIINYGWDYANSAYQFSLKYPLSDSSNKSYILNSKKRTITYNIPSMYSKSEITGMAQNLYNLYAYGNILFEGSVCITMAQYISPGYLYKHPAYDTLGIYVYEKELNINNNEIIVRGINLKKAPSAT